MSQDLQRELHELRAQVERLASQVSSQPDAQHEQDATQTSTFAGEQLCGAADETGRTVGMYP